MERPSHINFHASHPFARRLVSLGLAISLPLTVLWGLTQGMTSGLIRIIDPIHLVPDHERIRPTPPPPTPTMEHVEQIKPVEPIFKYDADQRDDRIIAIPPRPDDTQQPQTATGVNLAPVGVLATHTRPPYPVLAQRLGVEGKVTLRLTVLADGKVGNAEIVTSSGRNDLDDSARDWIVAHWAYKPALAGGQPTVSQVLATIIFSLKNAR